MPGRKLFWTNQSIDRITKGFEKVETENGPWETLFIDRENNQEWLRYVIDERGFQYNLIPINPSLTTDELIEIAITSIHKDEVKAAAFRLYYEEQYEHKENRKTLISRLQDLLDKKPFEKRRITTIIKEAHLIDNVNHREIVGKHYKEIEADAKYFRDTSNAAIEILRKIRESKW